VVNKSAYTDAQNKCIRVFLSFPPPTLTHRPLQPSLGWLEGPVVEKDGSVREVRDRPDGRMADSLVFAGFEGSMQASGMAGGTF